MQPNINTAICLLIKDENDYINEWLDWHLKLGFDHIYIYDNGSATPIEKSVDEQYKPHCTFTDFSGKHENTQLDCYRDAMTKLQKRVNWLAFIDTDEFIRTTDGIDINEFLSEFEDYDGIYIPWIVYNANGLWSKDSRPQRERFTRVVPTEPNMPLGKSIINTRKMFFTGVHYPDGRFGEYNIVDSNKKPMIHPFDKFSENQRLVIDHYFTRSYEEWQEKAKRGSCDERCERTYDEFFMLNPDMDRERI